ncbi:MAG: FG-GAP repeat protein [Candidatus Schekmanbacteria bacterium]|nr:FG-GAP repeat protein [Candidatus Schekmanbacteria bacterium]
MTGSKKLGCKISALFVLTSVFARAEVGQFPAPPAPAREIPGLYIVALESGTAGDRNEISDPETRRQRVRDFAKARGVSTRRAFALALEGFSAQLDEAALEELRKDAAVRYISPVVVGEVEEAVVNGAWGLDRIDQRHLPLDSGYTYGSAGTGVHVYVFDSGLYAAHTEFAGRVGNGKDLIQDGNGTADCEKGHGTHVAAIALGETLGVARQAIVHPVRIFDCAKVVKANSEHLISGVEWTIEHHIAPAVANMSLSFNANEAVDESVLSLWNVGITVVVAAGNQDADACNRSPARVARLLTVGAVDETDRRPDVDDWGKTDEGDAKGSNFGACVDIFAPGAGIKSAGLASSTATKTMRGTSMAAPHVAGVAAQYLGEHPAAHPDEVAAWILGTATTGALSNIGAGSPNRLLFARHGAELGSSMAIGDFNCDGNQDLALGEPDRDRDGKVGSGGVVVYWGPRPFASEPDETITQDTPGVKGKSEAGDGFGAALSAADFNGDTCDDLAIGAPGESLNGKAAAGAVVVLYGAPAGLTYKASQRWHQDSDQVPGVAETGDRFGAALTSGDFDGNGHDDLAIGVPGENVDGKDFAGAVNVLFGTGRGLVAGQLWSQNSTGIAGVAEAGDLFGASLTSGDFNGDQLADLVVGAPGEAVATQRNAGAIHVLYGSPSMGAGSAESQQWYEGLAGLEGAAELGDFYGRSVAAADFDGDGFDDLAVGIPGQLVDGAEDAGAVAVLYGQACGLSSAGNQRWTQNSPGIAGVSEAGDLLGASLAAGDLIGDGSADLAIGIPGEAVGSIQNAGGVIIIRGKPSGLHAAEDQLWHQDTIASAGVAESGDRFGAALLAGDLDSDWREELVIGVPGEDFKWDDAGVAHVMSGCYAGICNAGSELVDLD